MAKSSGIGSGLDDLVKFIMQSMGSKAQQRVRYNFAKKAGVLGTSTASSALNKKPPRRGGGTAAVPAKPKPKPKTPGGGSVGRIAATPPKRPPVDKYPKGKNIAQTPSEQRATERAANRLLRFDKKTGALPKSASAKPVDVRGSVINPPSKATMRPPKPRGSKPYEADPTRRFEGLPTPPKRGKRKGNQPKGTKPSQGTKKSTVGKTQSSSVKPKATMSIGKGKATVARDRAVRKAKEQDSRIQKSIMTAKTESDAAKLRSLNQAVANAKSKEAKEKAIAARSAFSREMMNRKK